MQHRVPAVRNAGATLHWGLDDPRLLEQWGDGLTLATKRTSWQVPGWDRLPRRLRLVMGAFAGLPPFREIGWILRYRFARH